LPTEIGFGSTEFHVLRANPSISPQFLYRLTTVAEFRQLGADAMTGAAGQQRVPQTFIANYPIALPPFPEQAAIVRFLDYMDWRSRHYIRAKQTLIKLLEEQKQAIIHHAVTRGLDPNVRLKPSGVEWLGDVPEHWHKLAIQQIAAKTRWAIVNGPFGSDLLTSELQTTGVSVVYIRDISSGEYRRVSSVCVTSTKAAALSFCKVQPGDILIAKVGDPPGTAATYPLDEPEAIITQDVVRIRPDKTRILPAYLAMFLNSRAGRSVVGQIVVESTRGRFSLADFKGLRVILPPLDEQVRICDEIKESTRPILIAASRAMREIDLLREYRTRLIADVVTGKLDVGGVELPEVEEVEAQEDWDQDADAEAEEIADVEEAVDADE
jgi:type I restriction enzyme S subunit